MAENKFVPTGAITIVPGTIQNEDGDILGPHIQLHCQGQCLDMQSTREGLAGLQNMLLEAVKIVGNAMVEQQTQDTMKGPKVVTANAMPNLRGKHRH